MEKTNSITKKIGSIYFSLLSPNEIRKMSGTKVITADTYDEMMTLIKRCASRIMITPKAFLNIVRRTPYLS